MLRHTRKQPPSRRSGEGLNEITAKLVSAHARLIEELGKARNLYHDKTPGWRTAPLNIFIKYCREIGIDTSLLVSPMVVLGELSDQAQREVGSLALNAMHVNASMRLAFAAAAVTSLEKRRAHNLDGALAAVAHASGLDKKKIRGFRNNISSGKYSQDVRDFYHKTIFELQGWPVADLMKSLSHLR